MFITCVEESKKIHCLVKAHKRQLILRLTSIVLIVCTSVLLDPYSIKLD